MKNLLSVIKVGVPRLEPSDILGMTTAPSLN